MDQRPPLPPFTFETAVEKVRKAENVVATYRQIDLCSRAGFSSGLVVVQGPDCGHRKSPVTDLPGAVARRCDCPSPRSPHALDDASLDELRRR